MTPITPHSGNGHLEESKNGSSVTRTQLFLSIGVAIVVILGGAWGLQERISRPVAREEAEIAAKAVSEAAGTDRIAMEKRFNDALALMRDERTTQYGNILVELAAIRTRMQDIADRMPRKDR